MVVAVSVQLLWLMYLCFMVLVVVLVWRCGVGGGVVLVEVVVLVAEVVVLVVEVWCWLLVVEVWCRWWR